MPKQHNNEWVHILTEITAEMNRTDENIPEPTFEDYAADIIRRLNFITTQGASEHG